MQTIFTRRRQTAARSTADSIYAAIVAQARRPEFYQAAGVPDTIDGRFDLLVMHAFAFFHRLKGESPEAREMSQLVFDAMFADLDQNLREMGVGDMSIGKKVRKMGAAFYGRARAYDAGLERFAAEPEELRDAIRRNVYSGHDHQAGPDLLAGYLNRCVAHLADQKTEDLLAGRISFPAAEQVFGE